MKHTLTPHDIALELADKYKGRTELNEANTRHQVIDAILHQVLAWPRSSVTCESYIHDEAVSHSLTILGVKDIDLFQQFDKLDRVKVRLERTRDFVNYLKREEEIERAHYNIGSSEVSFTTMLSKLFEQESERVLRSALRNYGPAPQAQPSEDDLWDDITTPPNGINPKTH